MKHRTVLATCLAAALAAAAGSAPAQDSRAAAPGATVTNAPVSSALAEARAALAKTSRSELPAALDGRLATLPIAEAIGLIDECLPKLEEGRKSSFLAKSAGMAMLMGAFSDAALRYESASSNAPGGRDAALLLKAGRCALAAGEADKATELSALVLASSADASITAAARLLGSWTLAFKGRLKDAADIAASIAAAPAAAAAAVPGGADIRREARFILWLCADAKKKDKAAAALAAEFPGSLEALVASGAAGIPPLPHWYLGELGTLKGGVAAKPAAMAPPAKAAAAAAAAAPPASNSAASPAAPAGQPAAKAGQPAPAAAAATAPPAKAPAAAPQDAGRAGRLQVGYYSVEANARRLASELVSKGFAASVEMRSRLAGSSAAADRRWIVLVDAGADPSATMRKLKDSGYESYGVE